MSRRDAFTAAQTDTFGRQYLTDVRQEAEDALRTEARTGPSPDAAAPTPVEVRVAELSTRAWRLHADAQDALERWLHTPGGAAGARLRALRMLAEAVRCDVEAAELTGGK